MANNSTLPASGDVVRDIDKAGTGAKTQVMLLDRSGTGAEELVTAAAPLPVYMPDVTATGTITVTDSVVGAPAGAGALLSGASTAGSLVAVQCGGGDTAWNVQITGLTSGTLWFEGSLDSTNGTDGNWINTNGRQTGVVNTVLAGNSTANGLWRGNTSGLKWFRVRAVGALSGTPAIRINISDGIGAIFLNASIPGGTNMIGSVQPAPSANAPTLTQPALAVTSFTVAAANANRRGLLVTNDSANAVYLAYAATASTTAYSVLIAAGAYWEMPEPIVTTIITGIALVATGSLRVTELVA